MQRLSLAVSLAVLAAAGTPTVAFAQCQLDKVATTGGAPRERLGKSVAISGTVALVGAPQADEGGMDRGAVYVLELVGGQWVQTDRLTASDGADADTFGDFVAIDGDLVVVGAPRSDASGFNSGAAYVFERAGAGSPFVETAKLTASDGFIGDFFGIGPTVEGETIVIGACQIEGFQIFGVGTGKAYVFERLGGVWTETQILTASDSANGDQFSNSTSLSGNRLLLGSEADKVGGVSTGSAYIFENQGGTWVETAKLTASDGGSNNLFGRSVSLDGTKALVGAVFHAHGGINESGAAYVFELEGGAWVEKAELLASNPAPFDNFGDIVSISGGTAVCGALQERGNNTGTTYVYDDQGGTWGLTAELVGADSVVGDQFGSSVAVEGGYIVVGARLDDNEDGGVYLFSSTNASAEIVRLGSPANPQALMAGQTSSTVLGATWDPFIDHTTFGSGAVADFLVVSGATTNVPIGGPGTLLCNLPFIALYSVAPGASFAVPIPNDCSLSGVVLCAQGASIDAAGGLSLANALDITLGNF
jgi:hypothetical protein